MIDCHVCYIGFWALLDHWQTLAVGILGSALALLGYRAARAQVQAIRRTIQAESMFKLTERFDSTSFREDRKAATISCLKYLSERRPDSSVDELLDLFEDAAFLVKINALDVEMMWHSFYYWIRLYYQASENYILACRKTDPTRWNALHDICPQLQAIEARHRRRVGLRRPYNWALDEQDIMDGLRKEFPDDCQTKADPSKL